MLRNMMIAECRLMNRKRNKYINFTKQRASRTVKLTWASSLVHVSCTLRGPEPFCKIKIKISRPI